MRVHKLKMQIQCHLERRFLVHIEHYCPLTQKHTIPIQKLHRMLRYCHSIVGLHFRSLKVSANLYVRTYVSLLLLLWDPYIFAGINLLQTIIMNSLCVS